MNQKSKVISHPNIGTWGQRRLPIIHSAEHNPRCQHIAQDDDYDDDLDVLMIVIASFAGDDDALVRDNNAWDNKEELKVISTAEMSMKAEFYVWKGENSFNHSNRSKLLTLHAERHIIKVGHSSSNETEDSFLQILKLHHDHRPNDDTSIWWSPTPELSPLNSVASVNQLLASFFTQFRCVDSQIRIIDWNWILTQWHASLYATLWELLSSNIKHRFISYQHFQFEHSIWWIVAIVWQKFAAAAALFFQVNCANSISVYTLPPYRYAIQAFNLLSNI